MDHGRGLHCVVSGVVGRCLALCRPSVSCDLRAIMFLFKTCVLFLLSLTWSDAVGVVILRKSPSKN